MFKVFILFLTHSKAVISVRSTRAHIFLLNRLNLGRNQVTKQEFTLLWEKNQQNSLTASYAAVIQKVNNYRFWKNLRWAVALMDTPSSLSGHQTLQVHRDPEDAASLTELPQAVEENCLVISGGFKVKNASWTLPPVPPTDQHWSDPSRVLPPQLGGDKALLNPIVHWVGANPGQFGIYHCTFKIFTKHIHKTLQPLGTQGREGSIENTAQGRQQEHLLSDSQERGGGEEEREVSYH